MSSLLATGNPTLQNKAKYEKVCSKKAHCFYFERSAVIFKLFIMINLRHKCMQEKIVRLDYLQGTVHISFSFLWFRF